MGFINLAEKTINAKLVYYGVGVGGKTTSLQAVHGVLCPRNEVNLVSIKTEEDATLLFDFLPINLGRVEGFKIRIQGFTVPGQPKYRRMRRYVLQGADAVVFVVDSQASRLDENVEMLHSLHENLRSNGLDPETIPLVLQYNKRDLDDILPEEELDRHFKYRDDLVAFPSVATENQGVFETFVHAAGLLVEAKVTLYGLGRGEVEPSRIAEGARAKLWESHDRVRTREVEAIPREVAFAVPEDAPAAAAPATADEDTLTDEDLSMDLAPLIEQAESAQAPDEDAGLLDRSIRSNVELAERFGELDQYRALLERKNRELVEVAQNAVHDLKRPLSAIKLLLTSMDKGYLGELGDGVRAGVENGIRAVQMMERLIGDLMDSSRFDFDGVRFHFREVDLTLVVADVLRTLRYEIEEHDVRVRVEPLPVVRGDEWALTKVFLNLIGNSLQYRHHERRPVVRVYGLAEPDRHVLVVEDNGIGIPEKDRERLFRRFERGSNTAGVSGTGLGLHIVKEVVMGHGGSVWVESEEGRGSRFFVGLPHEPFTPPHSAVSETAERADL